MLEFQEKRKFKKLIYSKITLVLLLIIIALLLNAIWGMYIKQHTAITNFDKTAAVYDSLQTRQEMISSEIERLKTSVGIEEEIRQKYGLVKPGEEVIVMVGDNTASSSADSSSVGFWQKIKDWFK